MWDIKEDEHILWIDIEPELSVKPDKILDCTKTGFPDKQFMIIFFDPPHSFGRTKNTGMHQTPSYEVQRQKWNSVGSYYGFDKFKTKTALLGFINRSQKEFYRVLRDNGVLWFKWSEIHASLDSILPIFRNWKLMMKFEVAFQGLLKGDRTWWSMFMKKQNIIPQLELSEFTNRAEKSE